MRSRTDKKFILVHFVYLKTKWPGLEPEALLVAPLLCDLGFCFRTVLAIKLRQTSPFMIQGLLPRRVFKYYRDSHGAAGVKKNGHGSAETSIPIQLISATLAEMRLKRKLVEMIN